MNFKGFILFFAVCLAVCSASLNTSNDGSLDRVDDRLTATKAMEALKELDASISAAKEKLDAFASSVHKKTSDETRGHPAEHGGPSKLFNLIAANIDEAHRNTRELLGVEHGVSLADGASYIELCKDDAFSNALISAEVYLAFLYYWKGKAEEAVKLLEGHPLPPHQEDEHDEEHLELTRAALVAKYNVIIHIIDSNVEELGMTHKCLNPKAVKKDQERI